MSKVRILIALLVAAWLSWQAVAIYQQQSVQTQAKQVVHYYEQKHGKLESQERRQELYDNARQVCAYLHNDPSLPELWKAMTDSGESGDAAVTTITAAIWYICPEYKYLVSN